MITKFILEVLAFIPNVLLDAMSKFNLSFSIPNEFYDGIYSLTCNIGYLFPVGALMPILITTISLRFGRAIWALVIRIKSFIPTMGS